MFLTHIELDNFKPLLHNDIKHFEASDLSNINILQAPNGFGKSSIMREMTPYPASRSDYGKHGKKVVIYTHNKSTYILTSDFSKANTHSFIKDGQELNISGNMDIQNDLVETHLGYNKTLDKLTSGIYLICDMTKSMRKELIYSTYPSSLYFLLDKYKMLMSKIRMFTGQLKLLRERQLSLSDHLVNKENLDEYNKEKENLTKANNVLDSEIYTICKKIEELESQNNEIKIDFNDPEQIVEECQVIYDKFNYIYSGKQIPTGDIHEHFIKDSMEIVSVTKEIQQLQKDGKELRDEVEQYRSLINDDTESSIKQCETLIYVQDQIIKNNPVDESVPIMNSEELSRFLVGFERIDSDLEFLKSMSCDHFSESEYVERESRLREVSFRASQELNQINKLKYLLEEYSKKLMAQAQYKYPSDCVRNCQLRINLDNILDSIKADIRKTKEEYDQTVSVYEKHKTEAEEIKKVLEYRSAARPILAKLDRLMSSKSWGDFVCFGHSLVDAVNLDITKIHNNFVKMINNSKAAKIVKEATDLKVTLEAKLVGYKSSSKPVKQLITSKLVEKENKLTELSNKLGNLNKTLEIKTDNKERCRKHEELEYRLNYLYDQLKLMAKKQLIENDIKFLNQYKSWYINKKSEISEKLRDLESILKEQNGYLTRLNDEIIPNIKEIELKIKKYTLIAEAISPTSGFPYKYTMRYVNSIFKIANQYIRKVWDYDIELAYFDEEKETNFDFEFKMLINGDSEIPDINLCSKGQKSMINLAVRLAICMYRGYGSQYPIKLDEITDGLMPNHVHKLIEFLSELFHTKSIGQSFIVNHDVIANACFSDAKYILLTENDDPTIEGKIISKIS